MDGWEIGRVPKTAVKQLDIIRAVHVYSIGPSERTTERVGRNCLKRFTNILVDINRLNGRDDNKKRGRFLRCVYISSAVLE